MSNIKQWSTFILMSYLPFGCVQSSAIQSKPEETSQSAIIQPSQSDSQHHLQINNQVFNIPTNYSNAIIEAGHTTAIGHSQNWHTVTNEHTTTASIDNMMTEPVLEDCKMISINTIIIPHVRSLGFAINSIEEVNSLSYDDRNQIGDTLDKDTQLINKASTYLINCMVAQGYYFDSTPVVQDKNKD